VPCWAPIGDGTTMPKQNGECKNQEVPSQTVCALLLLEIEARIDVTDYIANHVRDHFEERTGHSKERRSLSEN
jgi:hypothetical protein